MSINSISSKDSNETRTMHTKSYDIEIMMGGEKNYHKDLEEKIRGSKFICDSVDLLYYHLQKLSLKRGGSYIDSPK